MTRLERLKQQRSEMRSAFVEMVRINNLRQASEMERKLRLIEERIKEQEEYEPKRLSDQMPPEKLAESGLLETIIKTHMAADFLCDTAFAMRRQLDEMGFADCSLFPILKRMEDLSSEYAAIICHPAFAGLTEFQTTNEELISALHKKCEAYMKRHLKKKLTKDGHIQFLFKE